jgi:hypothetical protein
VNPKQQRFVEEYLKDLNATQAAIRAGYTQAAAERTGLRLLTSPAVQAAIEEAKKARSDRTEIEADEVLRQIYAIAMADPNGLVSFRRECCRYCWGTGHAWQFRTERERRDERRRFEAELARAKKGKLPKAALPEFSDGGIGFDPRRDPNPDCPECNGEGLGRPFIADTRKVEPELLALYAGIKETKDGIEVKVHPQDKMLDMLMRHLGQYNDKLKLSGAVGGTVETYKLELPDNGRG